MHDDDRSDHSPLDRMVMSVIRFGDWVLDLPTWFVVSIVVFWLALWITITTLIVIFT